MICTDSRGMFASHMARIAGGQEGSNDLPKIPYSSL